MHIRKFDYCTCKGCCILISPFFLKTDYQICSVRSALSWNYYIYLQFSEIPTFKRLIRFLFRRFFVFMFQCSNFFSFNYLHVFRVILVKNKQIKRFYILSIFFKCHPRFKSNTKNSFHFFCSREKLKSAFGCKIFVLRL